MPGNTLGKYSDDVALDVTNLHSLASGSTFLTTWVSDQIDNSTLLATDYLISGEIQTGGAPTAGTILILVLACWRANGGSPIWPGTRALGATSGGAAYAGADGLFTIVDTEQRDSYFRRADAMTTDATASRGYGFAFSLRDILGSIPPYSAIVIAHNTVQALSASNNAVHVQPVYGSYT